MTDFFFFLLGRQINNISLLISFHLLVPPSFLKVILITIFTNQPNCVIEVFFFFKKRAETTGSILGFIVYALGYQEGDKWLHFLLFPYFLWFHFVSSCRAAICHKLHKIKRSDMRYSHERWGTPTNPLCWPEVDFVIQVTKGNPGTAAGPVAVHTWEQWFRSFLLQSPWGHTAPGRASQLPSLRGALNGIAGCWRPVWWREDERMVGRKQALTS